ncbi:MAG: chitobiase/beta-hexosaminidase C-terminal domain-containing protein [Puniceicoccales bacterium]|nr:chitobiase/beta-hexosaminidase C-terminal domain-containing protein [Puniceicoccales bacterium]
MSRTSLAFRKDLPQSAAGCFVAALWRLRSRGGLAALLAALLPLFLAPVGSVRAAEVDEAHTIDVLFVYTAAAKVKDQGEDGIKARGNGEIEYNNKVYENSLINGKHRLVGMREVGYVESGDFGTDLEHLTQRNDGVMDEVHAWRDELGADLVCLMRATNSASGVAGLAWVMQNPQEGEQQNGFSVIGPSVNWSYAHEVGHNLGCAHDRAQGGNGIFYYAHGYHMSNGSGTIMSYAGTRVPHFSNPEVMQNGAPTGVSELNPDGSENHTTSANCAKTINLTLPVVAGYRKFKPSVEMPVITPPGGTFRDQEQTVTITCPTEGAVIHYTLDGSEVTSASPIYHEPFVLETSATVKARGFKGAGIPSDTAVATFVITYTNTVGDVVFSPAGGAFRDVVEVTLASSTPGAEIYYTFGENSVPTKASNKYSGSPLRFTRSTHIKARAFAFRQNPSQITFASYTVTESPIAERPVISLSGDLLSFDNGGDGKTYVGPPRVTITSLLPDDIIRYTLNPGEDVTESSARYTAPFLVTRSTTVKARVWRKDHNPSLLREAEVRVIPVAIQKPVITPNGGSYVNSVLVRLASATPDVYLRYTTNGEDLPDRPILLSENARFPVFDPENPIRLAQSTLLKVRAYHPDYHVSEQAQARFDIRSVENVRDEFGTHIAAGEAHSLFLSANGVLSAAGRNNFGQLGTGDTVSRLSPVDIATNVAVVDATRDHTLFITRDNSLYGVGRNDYGQLGNGGTANTSNPAIIASDVLLAAAGGYHTLFITLDGALHAVGRNDYGQLGTGYAEKVNPTPVRVADNVLTASAGRFHSLYLLGNGELWGMGRNDSGQLGNGTTANARTAVQIATRVRAIAAGEAFSLFLSEDGVLYATGANSYGQLGVDPAATKFAVRPVAIGDSIKAIAAGDNHALFVTTAGELYGLGDNSFGQLGVSPSQLPLSSAPVLVASGVKSVAAGAGHTVYTLNDDSRHSIGRNDYGQLGDGTQTGKDSPVDIPDGIPATPPELDPEPGTFEEGVDIRITGGDAGATFRYIVLHEGDADRDVLPSDTAYGGVFRISRSATSTASADEIVLVKVRSWFGNRPPSQQVVGKYTLKPSVARIAPAFTLQPVSQSVVAWNSATFAANATGTPAPTYQWYFNDNPIPGATNSTYTIDRASSVNVGKYRVRASNVAGVAESSEVRLELLNAPRITRHPQGAQLYEGTTLELVVSVASETDVAYQWRRDGLEISGATTPVLQIPNARASQSGNYDVKVSNSAGSLVSDVARVSILATNGLPIILRQPALASPAYAGGNVTFSVNVSSPETDPPRYQWRRDGNDLPGQTFATCALYGLTSAVSGDYTVVVTNSRGSVVSNPLRLEVNQAGAIVVTRPLPPLVETAQGLSVLLAVEVDAERIDPAPTYQWFFGGNPIIGATSSALRLSPVNESHLGSYSVEIVSGPNKTVSGPATLAFVRAPEILTPPNPETQSGPAGVGLPLKVEIDDGGAKLIEYQWFLNGSAIAGANSDTCQATASGLYSVRVTNGAGSVLGEIARVSIVGPPVLASFNVIPTASFTAGSSIFDALEKVEKSEGVRVAAGDLVRFEVALRSGGEPFEYVWYLDDAPLHGAPNGPVLETREITRNCSYSVRVTNSAGTVRTQNIRLRVIQPPAIIRHPLNLDLRAGSDGELSVAAEGSGQLAYQWYKDGVPLRNAVLPRLFIRDARSSDAGTYWVEVSNFAGFPVESKRVTVTIRNSNVAGDVAASASQVVAAPVAAAGVSAVGLSAVSSAESGLACRLADVRGGSVFYTPVVRSKAGTFVLDGETSPNGAPLTLPVGTRILLAGELSDSAEARSMVDDSVLEILEGNRLPNGSYVWKRTSADTATLSYVITHGQGVQERIESGTLQFNFSASTFGTYILLSDYVSPVSDGVLVGSGDFQIQK